MNAYDVKDYFLKIFTQFNFKISRSMILSYAFPISYVSFLFSGLIKGWGFNFFIDLTILFFLTSCFSFFLIERTSSISLNEIKKNDFLKPIISLMLFLLWYSFTAAWTLSKVYYIEKLTFICILVIIFLFPLFCKEDFVDRFLKTFIVFGVFISCIYFVYYCVSAFSADNYFPKSLKVAYLVYGRLIGGISLLLITSGNTYFGSTLRIPLIQLCLLMLIISGARGPILFFTIVLLIFMTSKINNFIINDNILKKDIWKISHLENYLYTIKFQKIFSYFLTKYSENQINILFSFLLFLLFCIFYFSFQETLNPIFLRAFSRLELLLNFNESNLSSATQLQENIKSGLGDSANIRLIQFYNIINYISDPIKFFIGWGIGSYGLLDSSEDIRHYPHNFILEIFVESGFVGISLFFIMVAYFLNFCFKKSLFKHFFHIILLTTYFFLCFLTSSSISEARIPFALLGIMLLSGKRTTSAPVR